MKFMCCAHVCMYVLVFDGAHAAANVDYDTAGRGVETLAWITGGPWIASKASHTCDSEVDTQVDALLGA